MGTVTKELSQGIFFNAISKYSGILINLTVTAVLARILEPEDFGVIAITTVITSFFDLLGNMGLGPAIIQNKDLEDSDINAIFSLSLLVSLILSTVNFLCSKLVGTYFNSYVLGVILQVLSIQILFTISNVVPYSMMLKSKCFRYIAAVNVASQFSLGILAIICALCGGGVYSLLIAPVGNSIISFFAYILLNRTLFKIHYSIRFSKSSINKVLSFSLYQFFFNIVNYFSRNLDKLIVGRSLSMSDLGYYEKSYRLMGLPLSTISSVLNPTVQPVFSNYQGDLKRLYVYSERLLLTLSYIGFFLTPLLFFTSEEIVLILFGDKWHESIIYFQILSISVFAQLIDSSSGAIMQSANEPKKLFNSGIICAFINIISIIIGAVVFKSVFYLSILMVIAFVLNLIVSLIYIYKMVFRAGLNKIGSLFFMPICACIIVVFALLVISPLCNSFNIIVSFVIKIVVAIIAYSTFLILAKVIDMSWIMSNYSKIKR